MCSDMGYAKDEPGGGEKRMLKQFQVVFYRLDVWYLGPIMQAKEYRNMFGHPTMTKKMDRNQMTCQ